jgi:hypothetical protein
MPGGDRTGPKGAGPMTGRGAGYCGGFPEAGFSNPYPGRGGARRFGWRGRSWRSRSGRGGYGWQGYGYRPPVIEDRLIALKAHEEWLNREMEAIRQEIDDLEKRVED